MLTHEQNELLCRVGPATAMGRVLDHYWFPVLLSAELAPNADVPKRVTLLGRRFVAFRGQDGKVAVLDEHCPHRGASLALGAIEDCGLRCIYHGWKIDTDGVVVDTPTEPAKAGIVGRVRTGSYPVHESSGMIWLYVGDQRTADVPPTFQWDLVDPERTLVAKHVQHSNWLQTLENSLDNAHVEILHQNYIRGVDETDDDKSGVVVRLLSMDTRPKIRVEPTEYGFLMGALRQSLEDPDNRLAVRSEVMIMPTVVLARLSDTIGVGQIFSPIDDQHTGVYTVYWGHSGPIDHDALLRMGGQRLGVDIDPTSYRAIRCEENGWLQDRAAMRTGTSYSGIEGFFNEDLAIGEGMGPIVSRVNEHLAPTDKAIVHLRKILFESIARVEAGEAPIGQGSNARLSHLRAEAALISKTDDWREAVRPGGVTVA
jgi:phthalate 4,5-dioxygenase oxygenase subunit